MVPLAKGGLKLCITNLNQGYISHNGTLLESSTMNPSDHLEAKTIKDLSVVIQTVRNIPVEV
ncbi:MAG: hypothetical protein IPG53_22980 [Ignavibacteriales bacterium]|nr:hypothetical protein [Ignavibacteriales bacterium]